MLAIPNTNAINSVFLFKGRVEAHIDHNCNHHYILV